jgi:hypothetical protein
MQVHQIAQLIVRGLLDGADDAAARVVHQHVDAAVSVEHLGDCGGDPVWVGDIELQGRDPVAGRLDEVGHRIGPARRGHHGVTGGQGGLGDRPAESRARAR